MAIFNKTKIFAGTLMGLVLLTTGCVPGREFSQEDSVEDTSVDISAAAHSGSTGAGASNSSIPAAPPAPPP